ncbi:MAG: hypothetical protein ACF8QF_11085 [Phycisphaerales bacterium]
MRVITRMGAVALAAGLAMPAAAQDSVAKNTGLPGDAVSPWSTTEQINDFVVDLAPLFTSTGAEFGIAPILKSSKTSSSFFASQISSQGISAWTQTGVPFLGQNYLVWNAAGFGVNGNPTLNDAPNTISPTGNAVRQGVAFAEFSTSDALASVNNIISGIVQFSENDPSRLFVRRVVAATNDATGATNQSQFGFGAVDSNGVVYFRADDFGLSGANPIVGENYLHVQSALRNGAVVNAITSASGATDGADAAITGVPLASDTTTAGYGTPTGIDSALAGRPVLMAVNRPPFGGSSPIEYVHEQVAGSIAATTAHRTGANDQRGGVHYSSRVLFPGTVGTAALEVKPGASVDTTGLSVWGVDANGNVAGQTVVAMPAIVSDSSTLDPYTFPFDPEFTNYFSQTFFRGGNGQVAVGMDADGRALVAGPITGLGFGATDPEGGIVVARFDPADPVGTLEWELAAWNQLGLTTNGGKGIYDDMGARIGELALLSEVTGGSVVGAPNGPSFSNPTLDAAGNLWYLAAAQLYRGNGPDEITGEADDDFDTVLIRAVYDPANFSWQQELVLEQGDVFAGQNSGRDWQVRFISIADSNSIDSATIHSGNMNQTAFAGAPIGTYAQDPSDERNLGGLVLGAEIVYDVNQDGDFIKVTGASGDPLSGDQEYNVLLYIGATPSSPCPTDLNGDGVTDGADLGLLLGAWGGSGPADLNGSGTVDGADLGLRLGAWGPCP